MSWHFGVRAMPEGSDQTPPMRHSHEVPREEVMAFFANALDMGSDPHQACEDLEACLRDELKGEVCFTKLSLEHIQGSLQLEVRNDLEIFDLLLFWSMD